MRSFLHHAASFLVLAACSTDPELAESDGPVDASAGSTGEPAASTGDADDASATTVTSPSTADESTSAADPDDDGSTDDGSSNDDTGSDPDSGSIPDCAFFFDDFASGDTSKAENGFSWSNGGFPVSDGFGHGDDHALRFEFGPDSPGEDSSAELRFELGRQTSEVWIELWVYYPTGEEGLGSARYEHRDDESSDNNKFLRLWRGEYDERPKVGASTLPTDGGDSRLINEYDPVGSSTGNFDSGGSAWVTDDAPDTCHRGEWTRVRMYFRISDPGASNGVARWWVGDTLVYEATDLPNDAADPADNYLERGYLLGWANSGFSERTHVYVDDVAVCDVDPGA